MKLSTLFVLISATAAALDCPLREKKCITNKTSGAFECCSAGEGCIPDVGCRCEGPLCANAACPLLEKKCITNTTSGAFECCHNGEGCIPGVGCRCASLLADETFSEAQLSSEQARLLAHHRSLPSSKNVIVSKINIAELSQQNQVQLDIGSSIRGLKLQHVKTETRENGMTSIFYDNAIFVVSGEDVTATVKTADAHIAVRPLGGGLHAILNINEHKLGEEIDPQTYAKQYPSSLPSLTSAILVNATKNKRRATVLSLSVGYTAGALSETGSKNAMQALIQLCIDETNTGYVNSGIGKDLQVRLANTFQSSVTETRDNPSRTLNDFVKAGKAGGVDANMFVLITSVSFSGICGVATSILANSNTAYCIGTTSCVAGYYTFGHELGHLQGARHDTRVDSSTSPFRYGHGFTIELGRSRTVMAYNNQGETRQLYWSTPNAKFGGRACGTSATNDNARVLVETAATVASWK